MEFAQVQLRCQLLFFTIKELQVILRIGQDVDRIIFFDKNLIEPFEAVRGSDHTILLLLVFLSVLHNL